MKHYEIWVTLEEWDGDSKIRDIETSSIGKVSNEDAGRQVFSVVESLAFAIKDHLSLTVEFQNQ